MKNILDDLYTFTALLTKLTLLISLYDILISKLSEFNTPTIRHPVIFNR